MDWDCLKELVLENWGAVTLGSYCLAFLTNSSTAFDMSKDLPPCTGGYSASVCRCWFISSPIGCSSQETFCIKCP
jgi:hypothetical protein